MWSEYLCRLCHPPHSHLQVGLEVLLRNVERTQSACGLLEEEAAWLVPRAGPDTTKPTITSPLQQLWTLLNLADHRSLQRERG